MTRAHPVLPFSSLLRAVSDLLAPRECVLCGRAGAWLCAACGSRIPLLIPACPVCRKETAGGRAHASCAAHLSLDGCLAAASLSLAPIERLIYGCKYHGLRSAAAALAHLIARAAGASPAFTAWMRTNHPVLSPLPLHPQRERARGYNQASLIARALARELMLPCRTLLTRIKPTADQVKLTREARRNNLDGAFSLARGIVEIPPAVILVDDVVTTGATFDAAARILRNARTDMSIWGVAAAYHAHTEGEAPAPSKIPRWRDSMGLARHAVSVAV